MMSATSQFALAPTSTNIKACPYFMSLLCTNARPTRLIGILFMHDDLLDDHMVVVTLTRSVSNKKRFLAQPHTVLYLHGQIQ